MDVIIAVKWKKDSYVLSMENVKQYVDKGLLIAIHMTVMMVITLMEMDVVKIVLLNMVMNVMVAHLLLMISVTKYVEMEKL